MSDKELLTALIAVLEGEVPPKAYLRAEAEAFAADQREEEGIGSTYLSDLQSRMKDARTAITELAASIIMLRRDVLEWTGKADRSPDP